MTNTLQVYHLFKMLFDRFYTVSCHLRRLIHKDVWTSVNYCCQYWQNSTFLYSLFEKPLRDCPIIQNFIYHITCVIWGKCLPLTRRYSATGFLEAYLYWDRLAMMYIVSLRLPILDNVYGVYLCSPPNNFVICVSPAPWNVYLPDHNRKTVVYRYLYVALLHLAYFIHHRGSIYFIPFLHYCIRFENLTTQL